MIGTSMDDHTSEKVPLEESSQISQILTDSTEFESNAKMQVITFNKMKLKYGSNEKIWAYFCVSDKCYQMQDKDRIGICQLPNEELFVSKQIIDCETDPDLESFAEIDSDNEKIFAKKTFFNANQLSASETVAVFYQFCYQSDGKILGRSTPFQITQKIDSLTNDDNEDEFVVVRSQESFLEERIEHLTKSNSLLQYLISSMEKDLSEKNAIIESLKSECNDSKNAYQNLLKDNEKLKTQLARSNELKNAFENSFNKLSIKHEETMQTNSELEKKLSEGQSIAQEKLMKDNELSIILQDKEEEIASIKQKNLKLEADVAEYQDKLMVFTVQVETLRSKIAECLSERRSLSEDNCNLEEKIKNLLKKDCEKSKYIDEMESLKAIQSKEIKSLEEELKNVITNFKKLNSKYEIESKKKQQDLTLEIDRLNAEYIEMRARLGGKPYTSQEKESETPNVYPSLVDVEVETKIEPSKITNAEVNTAVKTIDTGSSSNSTVTKTDDIPCTMCNMTIKCNKNTSGSEPMLEMIEHFEKVHNQKMCPVCSVLFDTRLPFFNNYFSNHVMKHFNSMKYPK